ncbi:MAG: hypothetical protein IPG59_09280 [Candidatus Melainabacteria bacterium]|nr:MAG: hypothetical protein IPG59_09280 [Candidatus Melainabacteria bacterium]
MYTLNSKIGTVLFSALLITVYCGDPALAKSALNFARSLQVLVSPDKTCVIQNLVDAANKDSSLLYVEAPDELLLIRKNAKNSRTKLLKYHRSVDVFWAPDSKAFVVNDWKDNNYCDAYLYDLGRLHKPSSLKQKLITSRIAKDEKSLIANKEYSYVFVKQWHSPAELLVKASGHYFLENQTVAYTLFYLWEMKTNRWKLLKKESRENLERDVSNMKQFGA